MFRKKILILVKIIFSLKICFTKFDETRLDETDLQKTGDFKGQKIVVLRNISTGFGNLEATAKNLSPEKAEPKLYETSTMLFKVASKAGSRLADWCCCMCFLQFCNRLNDQFAIALTQLCTALACFECLNVCCDVCDLCSCDQC